MDPKLTTPKTQLGLDTSALCARDSAEVSKPSHKQPLKHRLGYLALLRARESAAQICAKSAQKRRMQRPSFLRLFAHTFRATRDLPRRAISAAMDEIIRPPT